MAIKDRFAGLRVGAFARAVGVLVGGTALGHAITAGAMPILTRLYTPVDFGLLAVFSAVFAMTAVVACLRYEIAVALPEGDEEAANLLAVAVVAAVLVSALIAVVVLPLSSQMAAWLGQQALEPYLWLLPLCTLIAGVHAALQYWLVRRRRFSSLARTRIAQSAAAAGSQVALGLAGAAPMGLLAGPVANSATGCLGALQRVLHDDREQFRCVSGARMWHAARAHASFPVYSTAEALSNSASIQLPLLLIAALGSSAEAGHLMLALFVVQAPIALLGTAVSQVYLSRAPDELRAGTLGAFTADVIGGLLRTGAGPLLCLGIVAPSAFSPVFGDSWAQAGVVVAWLTPWFMVHFLTAPVSMALHVSGRQRLALLLQVGGLGLRVGLVVLAAQVLGGRLTEAYALSGLAFYMAYLVAVVAVAGCRADQLLGAVRQAAPSVAVWAAGGILAAALLAALGVR